MMGKEDEIISLTLSEPTTKLFRWILAFKKMADLILKADLLSTPSKIKSKEKREKQMSDIKRQENEESDVNRLQKMQQRRIQKEENRQKEIENSLQKERERLRMAAKNLDEKTSEKFLNGRDKKDRIRKYPVVPKSVLSR